MNRSLRMSSTLAAIVALFALDAAPSRSDTAPATSRAERAVCRSLSATFAPEAIPTPDPTTIRAFCSTVGQRLALNEFRLGRLSAALDSTPDDALPMEDRQLRSSDRTGAVTTYERLLLSDHSRLLEGACIALREGRPPEPVLHEADAARANLQETLSNIRSKWAPRCAAFK